MKIKSLIVTTIFLIVGLGMLYADYKMIRSTTTFLSNSEKTDGVVSNIVTSRSSDNKTMYSPEISFIDTSGNAVIFGSNISSSVSSYSVGEKVSVLYNKVNPKEAKINTFFQLWFGPIILTIIGLVFFLIGFLAPIVQYRKMKLKKELLTSGTKISAKVIGVNSSSQPGSMGDRRFRSSYSFFQISAQWLNPADNKMYVFESEQIDYNPESLVMGKEVAVYIDPTDPRTYYMDISSLPQVAE